MSQGEYMCKACSYIYIPSEHEHVNFEELPNDWVCPVCGVGKEKFKKLI